MQALGARGFPRIEERLHRLPTGFHAVGALKQDVVADHAVVDQRLIAGSRLRLEVILVAEFHLNAVDPDRGSGHFGVELQRDAFGRLDADHKVVLRQRLRGGAAEHGERRLLELDRHFGALDPERLAGAQVKGNAGPAPVIDGQFQRGIGFDGAAGLDVLGLAIVFNLGVADLAALILAAHGILQSVSLTLGLNRRQHVGLLGAHRMRIEPDRRLHRDQR